MKRKTTIEEGIKANRRDEEKNKGSLEFGSLFEENEM